MIPASYLFRGVYRDHFEEAGSKRPDPPFIPGRLSRDRLTSAILAFAYGASHLAIGSQVLRHERRR